MKPGLKSSEFWMSVLLVIFAAWLVHLDKTEAGISIASLVSGFWIAARTGMKVGNGGNAPPK